MLSELKPPKGAVKRPKRVGCGPGSGHGKTSTRGHKGAGQRKGKEFDARFEGGQMPFYRRIPKRGFINIFKKKYEIINLRQLSKFTSNTEINPDFLRNERIIKTENPIKILGTGDITVPLKVSAHSFSKSAIEKIKKAGGEVIIL